MATVGHSFQRCTTELVVVVGSRRRRWRVALLAGWNLGSVAFSVDLTYLNHLEPGPCEQPGDSVRVHGLLRSSQWVQHHGDNPL